MAGITFNQLYSMYCINGLSERQIAEIVGLSKTAIYSYRDKFGIISRTNPKYPQCPKCGRITNYLRDECLGFCPECLEYINSHGQIVKVKW